MVIKLCTINNNTIIIGTFVMYICLTHFVIKYKFCNQKDKICCFSMRKSNVAISTLIAGDLEVVFSLFGTSPSGLSSNTLTSSIDAPNDLLSLADLISSVFGSCPNSL